MQEGYLTESGPVGGDVSCAPLSVCLLFFQCHLTKGNFMAVFLRILSLKVSEFMP